MSEGTIIYVGGFELPDKNAASHRVLSNGKIFRNLGYNVVFADINKSLNFDSDISETENNVQGFEYWSLPYPKRYLDWLNYLTNIDYMNFFSEKYKDIKIIVAYNYPAIALNRLKKYAINNNIKIIADCTEWYSTKGFNLIFKIIKGLDSFFRMRIINKNLDGLIVISKYLENYYSSLNNVVRIPPLIDINEKKWTQINESSNVIDKSKNNVKFIYSGSPGKNKDKINYIVDAFYKLKYLYNYKLEIIGMNVDQFIEFYPEYKNKIKNLDSRISFIGRVSHIESLKILKNADYSIFIRNKTRVNMAGFPTKFVESITCNTPVITNNTSDIRDYFMDNSFGFLLKDISIEELSQVLRRILVEETFINENKLSDKKKTFHYERYQELMEKMLGNVLS